MSKSPGELLTLGKWAQRRAERKSLDRLGFVILTQMRMAQLNNDYRMLGDLALLLQLIRDRRGQLGR